MTNAVIGSLRVVLGADAAQFSKGLNDAQARLNKFSRDFGRATKDLKVSLPPLNVSGLVTSAGAAAASVAAISAAFNGMWQSLKFADELVATANKLGIATDALQALEFAAAETDVTAEQLSKGLAGLNAALGAFQSGVGAGRVEKVFARLGLTPADVASADNAAEFLPVLADRLAQVQTQAERVKLAKALGVEELLPLLDEGSAGIATLTERARRLGLVMDRDVAEGAAEAHRKLEIPQNVVGARLTSAFAELAESIIGPIDNMDALIGRFDAMEAAARNNLRTISGWFKAVADVLDAQTKLPWGQDIDTGLEKWLRDRADLIDRFASFGEGTKPSGRRGGSGTPQGPGFRGGYRSGGATDDGGEEVLRRGGRAMGDAKRQADDYRKSLADLYITLGDESAQATARLKERLDLLREGFEKGAYTAAEVAKGIRLIDEELERVGFNDRIAEVVQNVELDPSLNLPDWTDYRGRPMSREQADALREQSARAFREGLEALRYGGAEGVMQYLADSFSNRLLDNLADQLTTLFDKLLSQMETGSGGGGFLGGLGDIFGGIGSIFGGTPIPVPKFATGGVGRVGGSGGVDSKRIAMDLSPGELVAVTHGDPFAEMRGALAQVSAQVAQAMDGGRSGDLSRVAGELSRVALALRAPNVIEFPRVAMPDMTAPNTPLPEPMVDSRGMRDTRPVTFDMRGAVVTQDLLDQMNRIAATGDARVLETVVTARKAEQQRIRYTMPSRRHAV